MSCAIILDHIVSVLENSSLSVKVINQGLNVRTYNMMEERNLKGNGQSVLRLDRLGNMLRFETLTYRIFFANLMENTSENNQNEKPKMNNFQ